MRYRIGVSHLQVTVRDLRGGSVLDRELNESLPVICLRLIEFGTAWTSLGRCSLLRVRVGQRCPKVEGHYYCVIGLLWQAGASRFERLLCPLAYANL